MKVIALNLYPANTFHANTLSNVENYYPMKNFLQEMHQFD